MIDYYLTEHTFRNNKLEIDLPEGFTECNIQLRGIRVRPTGVNKCLIMFGTSQGYATARATNSAVADVDNSNEERDERELEYATERLAAGDLSPQEAAALQREHAERYEDIEGTVLDRIAKDAQASGVTFVGSFLSSLNLATPAHNDARSRQWNTIVEVAIREQGNQEVKRRTNQNIADILNQEGTYSITNFRGETESVSAIEAIADDRIVSNIQRDARDSSYSSGGVSLEYLAVLKNQDQSTSTDAAGVNVDSREFSSLNAYTRITQQSIEQSIERSGVVVSDEVKEENVATFAELYELQHGNLSSEDSPTNSRQSDAVLGNRTQSGGTISGDQGDRNTPNVTIDAKTGKVTINRVPNNIGSFYNQGYAGLFLNFNNENFVMDAIINVVSNKGLVYILTEAYRVDEEGKALLNSEYVSVRFFYGENPRKIKVIGYVDDGAYDATKDSTINAGEAVIQSWI